MANKEEAITRIKKLLEENSLDYLFLHRTVYTRWPNEKEKQYMIRELRIRENRVEAWQGRGLKWQSTINYLDLFDEYTVLAVEKVLIETIQSLKQYRVAVKGFVYVRASSSDLAQETVDMLNLRSKDRDIIFNSVLDACEIDD